MDGYNVIHCLNNNGQADIEDLRQYLVVLIDRYRPQGSISNKVTVVFDGMGKMAEYVPTSSSVKVMFSCEQSADDKIKQLVQASRNKANLIVVTNDRDVQYAVRAMGAKVLKTDVFLDKLNQESDKAKRQKPGASSSKAIPKFIEDQITSELKDIWVKKKNNSKFFKA